VEADDDIKKVYFSVQTFLDSKLLVLTCFGRCQTMQQAVKIFHEFLDMSI